MAKKTKSASFDRVTLLIIAALFGYVFGLISGYEIRMEYLEDFMEFFKRIR